MDREDERNADQLIDLGSVTEQTKGSGLFLDDQHNGQLISTGLSDD